MLKRIEAFVLVFFLTVCGIILPVDNDVAAVLADEAVQILAASQDSTGSAVCDNAVSFNVTCKKGDYKISITYNLPVNGDSSVNFSVCVDGKYPDDSFKNLSLRRFWQDDGNIRTDNNGNQFAANQICAEEDITGFVYNGGDFNCSDTILSLTEGTHVLSFFNFSNAVNIKDINLQSASDFEYKSVFKSYENYEYYSGDPIYIQGESAKYKSAKNIIPKCDNSDASLMPSSTTNDVVNYIGSSAWQTPGDEIIWQFEIEKSGLYAIGFKYRQNLVENGNSFRTVKIDGFAPYKEFSKVRFDYSRNWRFTSANIGQAPALVYLEKGTHTLTMGVTTADIGDSIERLSDYTEKIGELYRKIVMITGETPDSARSYNLFEQIPGFNEQSEDIYKNLENVATAVENVSGKGQSSVSTVRSMCAVLKKMIENPYTAHEYKNSYYSRYCSLSSCLYEMINMPLDIDYIALYAPKGNTPDNKVNLFSSMLFHIKRFIFSFGEDYSLQQQSNGNSVSIWINSGRDQAQVLENLIQTDFTEKTDINVNMKLTNASVIQAILSGNGPDCVFNLARSEPINLAMRGALYDLSDFDDFESTVSARFAPTAMEPYEYQGGYYALPDTQSFLMMFYRTDILSQLSCKPPETWDDFLATLAVLQRNNLQAGVGSNDMNMFATLLMQNGGSLYTKDKKNLNLDDETSIETFLQWCGFFTDYKMPVTADYYNRFRVGIMPIIVTNYSMYITLKVAAPEIAGKWKMVGIPGVKAADGSINNSQTSTGTGCSVLAESKNKHGAWELLKWWTSASTQSAYSEQVETILGVSGRVATSNIEALSSMPWDDEAGLEINKQISKINNIPEIPGGYYVSRVITQAYWNVVSNGQDARDMLSKWSDIAKAEIQRKRSQYNLDS